MTTNHLEKLDKALIRPSRVDMAGEFGLADASMPAAIFRAIYTPYDDEDETSRVNFLAEKFSAKVPEHEFSPAEIQGLLLRHKREPEAALENIDEGVMHTRKDKKQKEPEDAEKRRRDEEK